MPEERHFLTLVFADIPTALVVRDRQGNEAATRFLTEVNRRLDRIRRQYGGEEVRTVGSTMLSRFRDPAAALQAACQMRTVMAASRVADEEPQLRLGIHAGEVTVNGRSFYGEAVSASARLVTLCVPGQILTSGSLYERLPEAERRRLHPLEAVPDWAAAIGCIYEVVPEPAEASGATPGAGLSDPARRTNTRTFGGPPLGSGQPIQLTRLHRKQAEAVAPAAARFCLIHDGAIIVVDSGSSAVTLGREEGNDIVVASPSASRRHAQVEWREAGYYLVDHSWNGTYVYSEAGAETHVHNAEFCLRGSGLISAGCPGTHEEADAVRFVEAR